MRIKYLHLFLAFVLILERGQGLCADLPTPLLVVDTKNVSTLPKRFRMSTSSYIESRVQKLTEKGIAIPTRAGLANLNISGSAQFSKKQLKEMLKRIPEPLYIVDLREESHGFLNGEAISWYGERNHTNEGLSLGQIMAREQSLLERLQALKSAVVFQIQAKTAGIITKAEAQDNVVSSVMTESKLARLENIQYVRFPVPDREGPSQEIITQFVNFVKSLPPGAHLTFHCRAGSGRTTTFMILTDIIKNGNFLSFEDIVYRQYLLGGMNAFHDPDDEWVEEHAHIRLETLKDFYQQVTGKEA